MHEICMTFFRYMLHKAERALNTDAFISSKVSGKIAAPFF